MWKDTKKSNSSTNLIKAQLKIGEGFAVPFFKACSTWWTLQWHWVKSRSRSKLRLTILTHRPYFKQRNRRRGISDKTFQMPKATPQLLLNQRRRLTCHDTQGATALLDQAIQLWCFILFNQNERCSACLPCVPQSEILHTSTAGLLIFLKQIISQSHCKPPVTFSILITPCKSTWYIVF